jgi:8-oxo-dGTP pyrophosphatase MutT (NUDIX family)
MKAKFIAHLERRLQSTLPGQEAQFRMAHITRSTFADFVPKDARPAAVLALFYPSNDDWRIVLIERESHNPRDRHKGQISFPGGAFEKQDRSLADTALREAEEEIGVDASAIHLLGQLSSLYIPVSNFNVHPFVGFLEQTPFFRPQPREVKEVLEAPFRLFLEPQNRSLTTVVVHENLSLSDVPFFNVHGKVVWGATAMIMSELLEICGHEPPLTAPTG